MCGGQSNMEWSGDQGLQQSKIEAPNATNNKIRFFYVSKSTSASRQDDLEGKWMVCSPEEMIHFSAIGYFFGKNLNEKLEKKAFETAKQYHMLADYRLEYNVALKALENFDYNLGMTPIKNKLSNDVSYSDIRFMLAYKINESK